jgi:hypothetical protein
LAVDDIHKILFWRGKLLRDKTFMR